MDIYKEKYKRALEVMREWIAPCHTKEQLDVLKKTVFSELAESENETIRQKLIETIRYFRSRGIDQQLCEKFLAWLEEQKEEEGYEAIPVESTLEYKLGFKAGKDFEKQKEQKPVDVRERPFQGIVEDKSKYIVPSWDNGEQNPAENPEKDNRYWFGFNEGKGAVLDSPEEYGLCKPVEWSHIDELVFQDICKHLNEEGFGGWVVLLEALKNGEFSNPTADNNTVNVNMIADPLTGEKVPFVSYKNQEQKPNYCHYGGDPSVERCKYCSAACSARLTEEQKPAEIAPNQFDGVTYGMSGHSSEKPAEYPMTPSECYKPAAWSDDLDAEVKRFFDECIVVHDAKIYGNVTEKVIEVSNYELTARHFAKWASEHCVRPAEWSKEDERMMNRLIDRLNFIQYNTRTDGTSLNISFVNEIEWLKSLSKMLKKKNDDVKKLCSNEWSEEDEKILNGTLDILRKYGYHSHASFLNSKLKSLRPY